MWSWYLPAFSVSRLITFNECAAYLKQNCKNSASGDLYMLLMIPPQVHLRSIKTRLSSVWYWRHIILMGFDCIFSKYNTNWSTPVLTVCEPFLLRLKAADLAADYPTHTHFYHKTSDYQLKTIPYRIVRVECTAFLKVPAIWTDCNAITKNKASNLYRGI